MKSLAAEELSRLIDRYVSSHKSRSLLTLANKSGVGYTTIRRLAGREQIPSPATSLLILKVIADDSTIVSFSKKHWPEIGRLMERFSRKAASDAAPDAFQILWQDPAALEVFCFCSSRFGVSIDSLHQYFGKKISEKLEWLFSNKLLELKNERVFASDFFLADFRSIGNAINSSVNFAVTEKASRGQIASWQMEGLNSKGIQSLKALAKEYAEQVEQIMTDESNYGDQVAIVGSFFGKVDTRD